jgi:hypothetical protein
MPAGRERGSQHRAILILALNCRCIGCGTRVFPRGPLTHYRAPKADGGRRSGRIPSIRCSGITGSRGIARHGRVPSSRGGITA